MPQSKRRALPIAFVVWLALACCNPLAASPDRFPDDAAIRAELRAFVEVHRGAPGVVVGVIDAGGRRVIAVGESGRPERPGLDGATRFEIGSITKTFTGVLLADMFLAGEVSPEQRVATLFPGTISIDNGVQDASLEQLATHTSGLPRIAVDFLSLARTLSVDPYGGSTSEEVFRSAARVPRMMVNPGEDLRYSNLGYALLGRLLERRAGRNYEDLLRQRVLEPLGLSGMATSHSEEPGVELARGHGPGGRPAHYWHVDGYAPAGCLIASADDLLEYLAAHLATAHPAVAEAQRRRKSFSDGSGIGLGWMHAQVAGRRLVWHNGATGGFRSFVGFLPDEGRALVVLANGQGDVDALARRLLDPSEPALPPPGVSAFGWAFTLVLLAWGPLLLVQSIVNVFKAARDASAPAGLPSSDAGAEVADPKPRSKPKIDRFDVLRRPLSPAIALVLAERLGAWLEVPFAAWWGALGFTVVAYAVLVGKAGILPWRRAGAWSAIGRGLTTVLEAAVLAALFS